MATGQMTLSVTEERLPVGIEVQVQMELNVGSGLSPQATTLLRTLSEEVRTTLNRLQTEMARLKH